MLTDDCADALVLYPSTTVDDMVARLMAVTLKLNEA